MTLDTSALFALERGDGRVRALLRLAYEQRVPIAIPAGVVAQVWRGTPRQAPVAALLGARNVTVHTLDEATARAAGVLCGRAGTEDVVDATVALTARLTGGAVVTSHPDDLRRIDSGLQLHTL